MENMFFVLYAGAIPLVPLIGAKLLKQKKDTKHIRICYTLFFGQLIVSALSIYMWMRTH